MEARNPYAVGRGTPSPLGWLWTWSDLWLCMLASVIVVGARRAAAGGWVPKKVVVRFITGRRRIRWGAGRWRRAGCGCDPRSGRERRT